jgi:hypothetical protein
LASNAPICVVKPKITTTKNASIVFAMSASMQQLENCRTDFHEIWYWRVSLRAVDTFQFWFKSDNNNGHFTSRHTRVYTTPVVPKLFRFTAPLVYQDFTTAPNVRT